MVQMKQIIIRFVVGGMIRFIVNSQLFNTSCSSRKEVENITTLRPSGAVQDMRVPSAYGQMSYFPLCNTLSFPHVFKTQYIIHINTKPFFF